MAVLVWVELVGPPADSRGQSCASAPARGRSLTSEAGDSIYEMLEADNASEIEERLAGLLGISVRDLRDYMTGNIRAGGQRRTGYTFLRGTHGGRYVRDPNGTDILPSGFQVPA